MRIFNIVICLFYGETQSLSFMFLLNSHGSNRCVQSSLLIDRFSLLQTGDFETLKEQTLEKYSRFMKNEYGILHKIAFLWWSITLTVINRADEVTD